MCFFPSQSKLEQTSKESFELLYKEIHEVCVCLCMDVWDCVCVYGCMGLYMGVCLCDGIALV